MAQTKRATSKRKNQRTPFGVPRSKLTINGAKIPGYMLRWINDQDNRILEAYEGGYEHVTKDEIPNIGDKNVVDMGDLGTVVSRVVGNHASGEPMRAYLMKIDQELYEEDQRLKEELMTDVEDYHIGGEGVENSYVPRGAQHGITRD